MAYKKWTIGLKYELTLLVWKGHKKLGYVQNGSSNLECLNLLEIMETFKMLNIRKIDYFS